MLTGQFQSGGRSPHAGAAVGRSEPSSDEELLDRFLNREDGVAEAAFRTIVARHGPMVLGVCRHILRQQQDAEDAFQATFLVLAQGRLDPGPPGARPLALRGGLSDRDACQDRRGPSA